MPEAESLQESRMREIRTSGLTRGRASKPSLLYWQETFRGKAGKYAVLVNQDKPLDKTDARMI